MDWTARREWLRRSSTPATRQSRKPGRLTLSPPRSFIRLTFCCRIPANTKRREKVMQKELTINVDERVYNELQRIGGPEDISQFIESLILPQLRVLDLE